MVFSEQIPVSTVTSVRVSSIPAAEDVEWRKIAAAGSDTAKSGDTSSYPAVTGYD